MSITEQRQDLNEVLELLERGDGDEARALVQRLVQALDANQLVTTTQAAKLLRVRSVNTVKLLLKQEGATTVSRGNRTMVPLSEIERIQDSERLRAIRRSDQIHDGTEVLGAAKGLSRGQLSDLSKSRPGTLPWKAAQGKPSPLDPRAQAFSPFPKSSLGLQAVGVGKKTSQSQGNRDDVNV